MEECIGGGTGERGRAELSCPLQVHHPPPISMCPPTQKISEPHHLGAFMEVPLGRHDRLNHWPLVIELHLQSLFAPVSSGDGAESSSPLIIRVVPLLTSPHPEAV